ncbi:VRR-NUC domain-containing protein [Rhizobium leguminosarum]|uniref:VRR-NUC domain-containing protein n=1 Tax=Rhizobium leguminosarum TaxID=384 RepID=UPI000FEC5A7E|nr:VRR-NUC domain-containing protein [Rhizobium leguminosarum]RWX22596.1 VRR-NUC domain-containing protein [Rhizobium leguminosarum]
MAKQPTKRTTQTTKLNGQRVRIVTTVTPTGTRVEVKAAPVLEIDLQIAAVRELKRMPEYVAKAEDVRPGTFTLAADQNGSGFRGRNAAVKLKAAGMAAGEPDIRLYFAGGVLRAIEMKGEEGGLTDSQEKRFPLLRALGFEIAVVEAASETEAAEKAVAIARGWLAANDNSSTARLTNL